ncbi:hypothetical protein EYY60_01945 [Flavobacterium zhairuonense]|uniref:hypothetical protein n=1 Tax=Flavobacterium zhairuonense TaxID=2493631 RepID=UPI001048FB36|nr:hypothetical protein [Flavobacterium zhairuonense]KAF2515906.1 hypothetical protein EYY60_01945 [Flavobacterium zhairuonense]
MRKKFFALVFLLFTSNFYAQGKLDIKRIGFSIDIPKNWLATSNEEVLKNINNYDFTDKQIEQLFKADNSSVNLATFVKYDQKKYTGIIPTIKIRTREIKTNNISEFLNQVKQSNEAVKKTLNDFKYIDSPSVIEISGKKVIKFSVQFNLKQGDNIFNISSRSYYIPKDGYYISLNFIEEIGKEDNSLLFENLIKTISLTDKQQ